MQYPNLTQISRFTSPNRVLEYAQDNGLIVFAADANQIQFVDEKTELKQFVAKRIDCGYGIRWEFRRCIFG